jgi:hypothetical protein
VTKRFPALLDTSGEISIGEVGEETKKTLFFYPATLP